MIRLLDADRKPIAEAEGVLIWHELYYKCGKVELTLNKFYDGAAYIYNVDNGDLAVIVGKTKSKGVYKYSARMLIWLLHNKVIPNTIVYSNKTREYIAKDLVSKFTTGISIEASQGYGTSVDLQVTGANLMDYIYSLLAVDELSCKVDYDYDTDTLTFKVWQGADNTSAKPPLSTDYETLNDYLYEEDFTNYANYAYVAGEQLEGQLRTVVEVDQRELGEDKIEIFVDARDLQSETEDENGNTVSLTALEYQSILAARGRDKLAEYNTSERVPFTSPIDYVLGEKRTLQEEDLTATQRVVEVITSYQNGGKKAVATFGEQVIKEV